MTIWKRSLTVFFAGSDHRERLGSFFYKGESSMKITESLKAKLDNAASNEEVKKILDETKKSVEGAGIILDEAELNEVAGGYDIYEIALAAHQIDI